MKYDWEKLPEIVATLRHLAVVDLIAAASEATTWKLRGQIAAYDEILRLPQDNEEQLLIKEENDGRRY